MLLLSKHICLIALIGILGSSSLSHARERNPASVERKLAARSPEEQEYLKKIAESTSIHLEVSVTGMMFDGKKMVFNLKHSTPEGKKFKHRISKMVFEGDSRNPEYEKIFHEIYVSGRPCTIGFQMVTKEAYQSQYSVVEGEGAGSLNQISGSWITYVSIGD